MSTIKDTPSLAGQPDIFTQYQLVFMRDGERKPGVMQAVVKNLTDENIRDLGAYYAALPPPPPSPGPRSIDAEKVKALMTRAIATVATRRIFPARARARGWPASGRNISMKSLRTFAPACGAAVAWAR